MNAPFRVALVHYHLRPGGVTTVLREAAAALAGRGISCAVLAGEPPAEVAAWTCPVRAVPGLDYGAQQSPAALRADLDAAAASVFGGSPDVWYVHNHSLGRSLPLLGAVEQLAAAGAALLLHVHDFPEDGRPALYRALRAEAGGDPERLAQLVYPAGARVHYAALTTRDAALLHRAGAAPGRVHHLPNPVVLRDAVEGPPPGSGLRLYPTRAIRRKNLGEFLLWSACAPAGTRWATTLAPHSPADLAAHDEWLAFAHARGLPVDFAVGAREPDRPFARWLADADEVFTTSVAEGFGLAFLEPWLAGRPLRGRDLPEITRDFRAAGVQLPGLYERLDLPLAWIGHDAFRDALAAGLEGLRTAYGRAADSAAVDAAWGAAVHGTDVDFGHLDESLQRRALDRLLREPGAWRPPAPTEPDPGLAAANRRAIATAYSRAACADRLFAACAAAAGSTAAPIGRLDAGALLDAFLEPARFRLLRT